MYTQNYLTDYIDKSSVPNMNELACAIVIVLIIVLLIATTLLLLKPGSPVYEWMTLQPTLGCSDLDGRCYKISGAYQHGQDEVVNKLAKLNNDILTVIRYMRDNYLWNKALVDSRDPGIIIRKILTQHMLDRYNADVLVENVPWSEGETSYTKEKGAKMAICTREKQTGGHQVEDYSNTICVGLHELTHVATNVKDHAEPFWYIFKIILKEAVNAGVYSPTNYEQFPMNACGLQVSYNPYFDSSLGEEYLYGMIDQI